jgi:hypothetical protein
MLRYVRATEWHELRHVTVWGLVQERVRHGMVRAAEYYDLGTGTGNMSRGMLRAGDWYRK